MSSSLALLLLLGAPANCVVTDGRDPASIPKLDVPEPPQWEDIEHPEFEPYPVSAGLELLDNAVLEQFAGSNEEIFKRWKVSEAEREPGVPYAGQWAVTEPSQFKAFNNDKGLVLTSENNAGAIARKFEAPIDTTSGTKSLVLQYEVKNQVRLRCGGGYVKVLPTTEEKDYAHFSNETPYLVMFGPDKCGTTDKVHLILRRNGVEHHLVQPPRSKPGLLSTLYTLVIHPDLDFEIRLDGAIQRQGNMLDELEFEPPLVPPKVIPDVNDSKPEDWDDEEYIPSPDETEKPDDWDESEPRLISDPEAVKPARWREDIPLFIPDPAASKPEVWDDEEDGEYVVPEILNPECQNLNDEEGEGCGEWTAPLIKNPKFKGKWTQPLVPNPHYQGTWTPRRILNPSFHEEELRDQLSKMDSDIGGIGFELLTVQGNILFDNIYVGTSVRDAENIGNATWVPKVMLESESQKRAAEAYQKQQEEAENAGDSPKGAGSETIPWHRRAIDSYMSEIEVFRASPFVYAVDIYHNFIDLFRANKVEALKQFPVTSVLAFAAFHLLTMVFFGVVSVIRYTLSGKTVKKTTSKGGSTSNKAPTQAPVEKPAEPSVAVTTVTTETVTRRVE